MGIGTSSGSYYDSEFHQQAGWESNFDNETASSEPVKPKEIEDRRDEDFASPKWKNVLPNLRALGVSIGNSMYGTPQIPEAPVSELSKQLGHEDIKLEPNVGQSPLQRGVDDIAQGASFFKGMYKAFRGEPYSPVVSHDISDPTSFSEGTKFGNKLFGLGGEERHQLWPERMVRDLMTTAHEVGAGNVPMWSMDPKTGDYHTSIEGLEAAHSLIPAANGGMFPKVNIQLHPEATAALQEGPDVFQQFMATRGRSQQSNIEPERMVEGSDVRSFERELNSIQHEQNMSGYGWRPGGIQEGESIHDFARRSIEESVDAMSNHDFYHWGEHQPENGLTPAQEERWLSLDHNYSTRQHPWRPEDFQGTEADLVNFQDFVEERLSVNKSKIEATKQKFVDNPNVVYKGDIALLKDDGFSGSPGLQHYNFLSEGGVPGELSIRAKRGGKELYVTWIGKVGGQGPNEVGRSEMKNLFRLLADQFPNAEEITGFRVSGARAARGKIGDARMRIPGR